jgi:hypothetical protein
MSFYGLVMVVTLLVLSVYLSAFLGELSSEASLANTYSVIAGRMLRSVGAPPLFSDGG